MRKLDSKEAEELMAQISEQANKLRTTQDEIRSLYEQVARNKEELRKGMIAREAYEENRRKMSEQETELRRRVRHTISKKVQLLSTAAKKLKSHRIEPKKRVHRAAKRHSKRSAARRRR